MVLSLTSISLSQGGVRWERKPLLFHLRTLHQVPIAGGLVVATFVGGPVIFLAGLKLGMFAAIGGGIMGYATGKMFAEHE